jgi:hypothetical protein
LRNDTIINVFASQIVSARMQLIQEKINDNWQEKLIKLFEKNKQNHMFYHHRYLESKRLRYKKEEEINLKSIWTRKWLKPIKFEKQNKYKINYRCKKFQKL